MMASFLYAVSVPLIVGAVLGLLFRQAVHGRRGVCSDPAPRDSTEEYDGAPDDSSGSGEKDATRRAKERAKAEEKADKLSGQILLASRDLEFCHERRERLFDLLFHIEAERDACIKGGKHYDRWEKKALAIENQLATLQRRMDKAQLTIYYNQKKLAALADVLSD